MAWNGSVPKECNGSIPVFGLDKNEERNGTFFVRLGELESRTE
jgi:hypothetical protein